MLPLSEENEHTPEILICGGSNIDDKLDALKMSSQIPASKQCIRMVLDNEGIKAGWQVEEMPQARLMPDLVLLPNGGNCVCLTDSVSLSLSFADGSLF